MSHEKALALWIAGSPPLRCPGHGSMDFRKLSQSLDHYLEAILRMEKQYSAARVKDIAADLGLKKGSVVYALKKLKQRGWIVYLPYRPINLTDEGRRIAEYIGWRNGILMRFLVTVLHLMPCEAEAAARRMGYAVEEKVIERMWHFMAQAYADAATNAHDV